MKSPTSDWIEGHVSIFNGIFLADGVMYPVHPVDPPRASPTFLLASEPIAADSIVGIGLTDAFENSVVSDSATGMVGVCGECGAGADGFVALQLNGDKKSLLWLAFFDFSNPFERLEFKEDSLHLYNNLDEVWIFSLSCPWEIKVLTIADYRVKEL